MTEINADLFTKAADEIERRGLNKGSLVDYDEYDWDPNLCKVCMWGAINVAHHGDPGVFPGYDEDEAIKAALLPFFPDFDGWRPGVTFNDGEATKEDVVAKLREIAASLA